MKHQRIPPLFRCSVQRKLMFCRKRTQNVDLSDPVCPAIIQANVCLNVTSALIALDEMSLSPRHLLRYTRTYYRLADAP